MNTKLIASAIVAIAAMTSASAFAQSHLYGEAALVVAPVASTSTLTRAQVDAAYIQARQNGAVAVSQEAAFAPAVAGTSTVNRAQVMAEAVQAAQLDGGARRTSTRTRTN